MSPFADTFTSLKNRLMFLCTIVSAGAAATYMVSPEQSTAVVVATILQVLGNLAGNYGAADVYDAISKRLSHKDILHNEHLAGAVRDAIGVILRDAAGEVEDEIDKEVLLELADVDPEIWKAVQVEQSGSFEELSDNNLVEMFSKTPENFATSRALTPEAWGDLLSGLEASEGEKKRKGYLRDETRAYVAVKLHENFTHILYELLKYDFVNRGEAYGGLLIKLVGRIAATQSETLDDVRAIRDDKREFLSKLTEIKADTKEILEIIKRPLVSAPDDPPLTFHKPPNPYVAYPYIHSSAHGLVGRKSELERITQWASADDAPNSFLIEAIGGMGKSALAWHWLNNLSPQLGAKFAGKLWWSFYEPEATMGSFIVQALHYLTNDPIGEIEKLSRFEQQQSLIALLSNNPCLLVLDGIERILLAFARVDAAFVGERAIKRIEAKESELAGTVDPHDGAFLRRLTFLPRSRILITSRLFPSDLKDVDTGDHLPVEHLKLRHLQDVEALDFWKAMGLAGNRADLLTAFHKLDKHPLFIKVLGGIVKKDRETPGNFNLWWVRYKRDDIFTLDQINGTINRLFSLALNNISGAARQTIEVTSTLRRAVSYKTLSEILIGEKDDLFSAIRLFSENESLNSSLDELETAGLLGWDKGANIYDLHPVIREGTNRLIEGERRERLNVEIGLFFGLLRFEEPVQVSRFEDLASSIDLFHSLGSVEAYDEAWHHFWDALYEHLFNFGSAGETLSLANSLVKYYLKASEVIKHPRNTIRLLLLLYSMHFNSAKFAKTRFLARSIVGIAWRNNLYDLLDLGWLTLAKVQMWTGQLREAELAANESLKLAKLRFDSYQVGLALLELGLGLLTRGLDKQGCSSVATGAHLILYSNTHVDFRRVAILALHFLEQDKFVESWFRSKGRPEASPP